jgi:hypothetical protein
MKLTGFSNNKQRILSSLAVLFYMSITIFLVIPGFFLDKPFREDQPLFRICLLIGFLILVSKVVICIIALFKKAPAWSLTWFGTTFFLVFFIFLLIGDDKEFVLNPVADSSIMLFFLLVYLFLLIISAKKGWQYSGLYGMGISAASSFSFCFLMTALPFNQYILALLVIPLGILAFFLLYFYINAKDLFQFLILLAFGVCNLICALLLFFVSHTYTPSSGIFFLQSLGLVFLLVYLGPVARFVYQHVIKRRGK